MDGRKALGALAALSVCAWSAGCESGAAPKAKTSGAGGGLTRPLYPRCATTGFAKPVVTRLESDQRGSGATWSLQYRVARSSAARAAGRTMNVVVVEASPASRAAPANPGSRAISIAGRGVTVHAPVTSHTAFTAQWKTPRANYAMVADGEGMSTIGRFVACLP